MQLAVLRTAITIIDFIYYAQLQVHTSDTLLRLETALKTFHENKDVFIWEVSDTLQHSEDPPNDALCGGNTLS